MLVLSRQRDEVIMIGDDIRITVVDIRLNDVKLGIDAPKSVPVHRLEVWEAKQRTIQDQIDFDAVPPLPRRGV